MHGRESSKKPICAHWITPVCVFQYAPGADIATNRHKPGWMNNFEAEREKAKATCYLLLLPVPIPDRSREALCARASLVGQILGTAQRTAVAQPSLCTRYTGAHVQVSYGHAHRPQRRRKGIGEEAGRIYEQQQAYHPRVGSQMHRRPRPYTFGGRTRERSRHIPTGPMRGHMQRESETDKI